MPAIKGKQIAVAPDGVGTTNINANAVTSAKVDASVIIASGANAFTGDANLGSHKVINGLAGTAASDFVIKSQLDAAIAGITSTLDAAAVSVSNIAVLSGLATTVDGVLLGTGGMVVLLTAQAPGALNGLWVVHAGAWTRPANYPTGGNSSGAFVFIKGGTTYAGTGWITVNTPDVIDTNPSIWTQFTAAQEVRPTPSNKNMVASVTAADGNLACATAVALPNSFSGYIGVNVNGVGQVVGDGTKVGVDCYFSADGGVTARAFVAVIAGDLLYWNGSVAGYQLAAADRLDFFYETVS